MSAPSPPHSLEAPSVQSAWWTSRRVSALRAVKGCSGGFHSCRARHGLRTDGYGAGDPVASRCALRLRSSPLRPRLLPLRPPLLQLHRAVRTTEGGGGEGRAYLQVEAMSRTILPQQSLSRRLGGQTVYASPRIFVKITLTTSLRATLSYSTDCHARLRTTTCDRSARQEPV